MALPALPRLKGVRSASNCRPGLGDRRELGSSAVVSTSSKCEKRFLGLGHGDTTDHLQVEMRQIGQLI